MMTISRLEIVSWLLRMSCRLGFCAKGRRAAEEILTQQLRQRRAEQAVAGAGKEVSASCLK